ISVLPPTTCELSHEVCVVRTVTFNDCALGVFVNGWENDTVPSTGHEIAPEGGGVTAPTGDAITTTAANASPATHARANKTLRMRACPEFEIGLREFYVRTVRKVRSGAS